ncbi:hypothetical protein Trydic_g16127 [Trypoxylus dichotomus]
MLATNTQNCKECTVIWLGGPNMDICPKSGSSWNTAHLTAAPVSGVHRQRHIFSGCMPTSLCYSPPNVSAWTILGSALLPSLNSSRVTTDSYASTELDKIEYFINTKPFACFLVALSPYPDLNIRRKCLGILRKTSLIAEALSVQNDPELGMFEVNATKFLTVISNNNLEQIDWITAALCLYLIVESEIQIEIEVAAQIASNMLASSLKDEECIDILVHNTYKRFEKILHTIDSPVTLISSNFMIAAWYPFQNGFNGIAHYRSVNTTGNGYLKTFSSNQTLKQESLRLAFYVPYEFLEDLVQNSLSKAKNDLFIIIYVQYVDNHPQLLVEINMKIPEYCKRNELPVLSVRYENDSWEYELGKENFDSTNGRSKCVLSSSFRIFLRVIDREESWTLNHYTGEGYWLTIPPSRDENLFTVYISETNTYDYCGSPRNIEMWAYWVGRNTYEAKEKVIARKIDLLSMISMAVNNAESKSGTEEIFNKYSSTFKLFRMFGSIASMLGITSEGYASTDLDQTVEQWIDKEPSICFDVVFEYYSYLNVRRKCLNILRKMSAVAEALSVQDNLELPMFEVNVTKLIIAITNENPEQIGWIIAALCLFLIEEGEIEIDIETATQIASNMLTSSLRDDGYIDGLVTGTYNQFERMLHRLHSPVTLITSNLIIVAWYPFRNGFNGIARYRSGNSSENDYLKKFSSNQTFKQENLRLALYVPYEFLEDLVQNSSSRAKSDLFIIMHVQHVYHGTSTNDEINLQIPGYCKWNELPILRVRYENDSQEYEFGREYFDSTNGRWKCILSRRLKFVKLRRGGFFESAKLYFCMRRKIGETYFPQTPRLFVAYPESFCVNGNAKIPYLYCSGERWVEPRGVDLECRNNHRISINTGKIYKLATQCHHYESSESDEVLSIINSSPLAYLDMKMFFNVLDCLNQFVGRKYFYNVNYAQGDFNAIFDSINKLLEYSNSLPSEYLNSTSLHQSIVLSLSVLNPNRDIFRADDNYIYQRLLPSSGPLIGLVVYKHGNGSFKEYEVKYLTPANASSSYTSDQSVEVIIYITGEKNISADCFSSLFIVRHNLFPENDKVTARSRSIAIERCFPLELRIFLRVIDREESWRPNHYTGEGYWLNIPPSHENLFTVYIGETNTNNYCSSTRSVKMWAYTIGFNTQLATKKVIARKIDLLSMISMANIGFNCIHARSNDYICDSFGSS